MRVLIACEESQAVCKEFRRLGHEAYSCDIQDCSGGHPEWHIKGDVFHVLHSVNYSSGFDLLIGHPPCTYLSNSGVRWLYNPDGSKNEERWEKMRLGALFFKSLLNANAKRVCIENPIIHKYALEIIGAKPRQVIQPWMYGHGETKATCLWLRGLPRLNGFNVVEGREQRIWKMPPGENRAKERSKTYLGVAHAMANQWGGKIETTVY